MYTLRLFLAPFRFTLVREVNIKLELILCSFISSSSSCRSFYFLLLFSQTLLSGNQEYYCQSIWVFSNNNNLYPITPFPSYASFLKHHLSFQELNYETPRLPLCFPSPTTCVFLTLPSTNMSLFLYLLNLLPFLNLPFARNLLLVPMSIPKNTHYERIVSRSAQNTCRTSTDSEPIV